MNKLITEANKLFAGCGFTYYVCGGFALELFVGRSMRAHSDLDISVFAENKRDVVALLQKSGWDVYKKIFKPGSLGLVTPIANANDEKLDDIWVLWAVNPASYPAPKPIEGCADLFDFDIRLSHNQTEFNFIEIVLDNKDGDDFVCSKHKNIRLALDKAILYADGVPYMAPELALFLKSPQVYSTHEFHKGKTPGDYKAIMPLLSSQSKKWLLDALDVAYPDGYDWLDGLLA